MGIDISKAIDEILEGAEQHRHSFYPLHKDKRVRFKVKKVIDKVISDVRRENAETRDSGLHLQRVSKAVCDCELPSPVDPHDNFEKHICSKCSGFITQTDC